MCHLISNQYYYKGVQGLIQKIMVGGTKQTELDYEGGGGGGGG